MKLRRLQDHESAARPRRLKVMPWWMILIGVVTIVGATWASTAWLLAEADKAPIDKKAALRIDAIRTGLSVGAGAGGAFALLLAARRQWLGERAQVHQEQVAASSELDATERRITDLYTKAIDQLGNDNAAVRLGGLHALERLGLNHPEHRQTIVDVLCAYLRMPFTIPIAELPMVIGGEPDDTFGDEQRQELQVRLTVQRILARHLAPDRYSPGHPAGAWQGADLDLSGAVIVGADFSGAVLGRATFRRATLYATGFNMTVFNSVAIFEHTVFDMSRAPFRGAEFNVHATFTDAEFRCDAWFNSCHNAPPPDVPARFRAGASFARAAFHADALFSDAIFDHEPNFTDARVFQIDRHARIWPAGWSIRLESDDNHGILTRSSAETAEPRENGGSE